MKILTYECGCVFVRGRKLEQESPPLARCDVHRTNLQSRIVRYDGWVGLDTRSNRYVWTANLHLSFVPTGRILFEVLCGHDLGTVDGAILRCVGGRDRLVLSQ